MVFLLSLFFFLIGSFLGSFATAVTHRIESKKSWIFERGKAARSRCPNCQAQLNALDLIPIFSWILLKGHCRHCKSAVPRRYLFIELVSASVSLVLYLLIGLKEELILCLCLLPFALSQLILILRGQMLSKQLLWIIGTIITIYAFLLYIIL